MYMRHEQAQKKQEAAIGKLANENSSLRHQLDEMALKAEEWACRAQEAEAQLEEVNLLYQQSEALKAENAHLRSRLFK